MQPEQRCPILAIGGCSYAETSGLYYGEPPTFDQILGKIAEWRDCFERRAPS
jgi:hypothetical protein